MAIDDYDLLAEKLAAAIVSATSADSKKREEDANFEKEQRARQQAAEETLKFARMLKETGSAGSMFKQILLQQKKEYIQLEEVLSKLDEEIRNDTEALKNFADAAQREAKQFELQQKIKERASKAEEITDANRNARLANQVVGMTKFSDQLISSLGAAGAGLLKGLQQGGTGISSSGDILKAGVDFIKTGMQGGGSAAQGLGTALMALGGKAKAAGVALTAFGLATGYAAAKLSDLAKFGISLFSDEINKTVEAYRKSNNAGALFSDGMMGLRNAAGAAGLTLTQFAEILTKHSNDLAMLGEGVASGSNRMSRALSTGGGELRKQLLNLGYSIEEQGGLVAETMAQMRQSGNKLMASDKDVAQQTVKYAENLRVIAAITGEDAKKKSDQVRQQASQLAFQQKLAGMDEKQRTGIIDAMKNMSDLERRNFMDMVNFGTVINKEGAAAQAMSGGLTNAVNEYYDAFRTGTLNEISAREISSRNTGQQKQDLLGLVDVAAAQAAGIPGFVEQLGVSLGKELEYRNKWTEEAIKAAELLAGKQKATVDPLTSSVSNVVIQMNEFQRTLEQKILGDTGALTKYAEYQEKLNNILLDQIQKWMHKLRTGEELPGTEGAKAPEGKKTFLGGKSTGDDISKVGLGTMLAAGAVGIGSLIAGFFTGGATVAPGLAMAGTLLNTGGALTATGAGLEAAGYAGGGIARKPSIFGEAGPEAAVPLPDGRSIPVTIKMLGNVVEDTETSLGKGRTMQDLADLYRKFIAATTGLSATLQLVQDLNDRMFGSFKSELTNFADTIQTAMAVKDLALTAPAAPTAAGLMMLNAPTEVGQTLNDLLTPQINAMTLSQNILTDIGKTIDAKLGELATEVKAKVQETKVAPTASDSGTSVPAVELAEFINQLKVANSDLKETILVQNRLLEQNVRTSEQLLSVASDTRNFSQSIAQNTL